MDRGMDGWTHSIWQCLMHDKTNIFHKSSYSWRKVISKMSQKVEDLVLTLKEVDREKRQKNIPEKRENYLIIDAKWGYVHVFVTLEDQRCSHQGLYKGML